MASELPRAPNNTPGLNQNTSQPLPYTCSVNYYIDGVNGNDKNPGTRAAPWKSINNADNGYPNTPVPGECVNVLPATYTVSASWIMSHGGNAASPSGYVVYRSTQPGGAHIVASGQIGDLVQIWVPYIIIDGFDIDGNHAATNGHGLDACTGGGQAINIAHHFWAMNNTIHDMGGAGLNTCSADYILWRNNVVYNTSSTNPYQVSGIDVWEPKAMPAGYVPTAQDTSVFGSFGIKINYNVTHDNLEGPAISGQHTDGNGIIIDTTYGSAECPTCGVAYTKNILLRGNVSYRNGGAGIRVFLSENVVIINNTAYDNDLDTLNPGTARGELSNGGSCGVTWKNNIAYAVPGGGSLAKNGAVASFPVGSAFADSGGWSANITYGGPVIDDSRSNVDPDANLLNTDPQFTNLSGLDFRLSAGSPAIASGTQNFQFAVCPSNDATLPPPKSSINIGAYWR